MLCTCAHAVLLATLVGVAQLQGALSLYVYPTDQISVDFNPKESKETPPNLPMNKPPLTRTAKGFQPEGIHLLPWKLHEEGWDVLVSWQTGASKVAPTSTPPVPYDPDRVASIVKYGLAQGQLDQSTTGNIRLVYEYIYGPGYGNMTYQSPIVHHVLLRNLTAGATYYYAVGNPKDGFSEELLFKVPGDLADLPVRIGVIGDPGQTNSSWEVFQRAGSSDPDVVLLLGDLAYADEYFSNGTKADVSYNSDQRRWDTWARMTQPLLSRVPGLYCNGNHELEQQQNQQNLTFLAYNARYPTPQDPSRIDTSPNYANTYLNTAADVKQFINSATVQPNNSYYSVDLPGAHLIVLSNYMPYGPGSRQLDWFLGELGALDRERTPWLLVMFHSAPRQTYVGTFKQVDDFMSVYEPLFYQAGVDVVLGGHAHAYERSYPLFNFTVDWCGPMYLLVGDGGTMDGMSNTFIDQDPQPYCQNPELYTTPWYQPTDSGEPLLTFQDGQFCPTEQPAYSAYRDPSYGYGMLTLLNATHAEWAWYRNQDEEGVPADSITITKNPDCAPLVAPTWGDEGEL